MGIRHSSRCMLLRRKMAESESGEVSPDTLAPLPPLRPPDRPEVAFTPLATLRDRELLAWG